MNHLSSHAQYTWSSLEQFIDNGELVLGHGIIDSKGELKISEQDAFGVDDKGNIVRRIIWQFPELKSMIRRDMWTSRED